MASTPTCIPAFLLTAAFFAASSSATFAQSPRPDHTWIPAQYRTVSSKEYIAPQFRTVEVREWIPPQYRSVEVREWSPTRYEDRVVPVYIPPRHESRWEWVTDHCGHIVGRRRVCVVAPGTGVWVQELQRVQVPGTGQHVSRVENQLVPGTGVHARRTERVQVPGTGLWVDRVATQLVPGTGVWVPTPPGPGAPGAGSGAPAASSPAIPPAPLPGAPPATSPDAPRATDPGTPPSDVTILKATGEVTPRGDVERAVAYTLALRDARRRARETLRGAAMAVVLSDGTKAEALAARQPDAGAAIDGAVEGAVEVGSGFQGGIVVATLAVEVEPLRAVLEEIRARERRGR